MDKDPYLSELDAIDEFEAPSSAEEATEVEAPTRIDLQAPPLPPEPDEPVVLEDFPPQPDAPVRDILELAPDLAVPLLIVMGRKSFSVQDLLELRLGQIMDLDREPLEPVDLVAGGKVIGKGELVEVDGKIGVRVLKLFK